MGLVKREWLQHGCLKLDEFEERDRISLRIRDILGNDYGEKFAVRSWPQQNYRDTLWWYEKSKLPSTVASYFLKIDGKRGPNLYAGVSVERNGVKSLFLTLKAGGIGQFVGQFRRK